MKKTKHLEKSTSQVIILNNQSISKLLKQVNLSHDDVEYKQSLITLSEISKLVDAHTSISNLLGFHVWKLKTIICIDYETENENPEKLKIVSDLENLIKNYVPSRKSNVNIIFKNISLLHDSLLTENLAELRKNFSNLFKTTLKLLEKHSPALALLLEAQAFDILYNTAQINLPALLVKLENIKPLYQPDFLDKMIEIMDSYLENHDYQFVNSISNKIIPLIRTEVVDDDGRYYLIMWNMLKLSSSRNISMPEIALAVNEVVTHSKILIKNKWAVLENLVKKLQNCVRSLELPALDNCRQEIQLIYLQLADLPRAHDYVMDLINRDKFNDLQNILKKIAYAPNIWEILKSILSKKFEKLIENSNPHRSLFYTILFLRKEALPFDEYLLPSNNGISSVISNQNQEKSRSFQRTYQYIFTFNNNQFLLGTHELILRKPNFLLTTENLTLPQVLRNNIALFCVDRICTGMPAPIVFDILKKYKHKPKSPSAGLRNTAACATQYFANNYAGLIVFERICNLFTSHLLRILGAETLIVKRSLRQLIYMKAEALGKEGTYLTDSRVKELVENAKEQDERINQVMALLGWEVKNHLVQATKLIPLSLSIHQLVTALGIMWVNHFTQSTIDHIEKGMSPIAKKMANWILQSNQLSESKQIDPSYFNFILSVKVPLFEGTSEIQNRRVKITTNNLVTFFTENLQKLSDSKSSSKRKTSERSYYKPWSFTGSVQLHPPVIYRPPLPRPA